MKLFYGHSSPSPVSRRAQRKYVHELMINLPRKKMWVRLCDRLDTIIAADSDVKPQTKPKTNQRTQPSFIGQSNDFF